MIKRVLILVLTLSVLLTSCRAKKLDVKEVSIEKVNELASKEKAEIHVEKNVKKEVKTVTTDKGKTVTETTTATPIDPTKEMTLIDENGKLIKSNNAVVRLEKMIHDANIAIEIMSREQDLSKAKELKEKELKKKEEEKAKLHMKELEKKVLLSPWLFLLIIPLVLVIGVLSYYKKYSAAGLLNLFKKKENRDGYT